jgi:hypothetical protein
MSRSPGDNRHRYRGHQRPPPAARQPASVPILLRQVFVRAGLRRVRIHGPRLQRPRETNATNPRHDNDERPPGRPSVTTHSRTPMRSSPPTHRCSRSGRAPPARERRLLTPAPPRRSRRPLEIDPRSRRSSGARAARSCVGRLLPPRERERRVSRLTPGHRDTSPGGSYGTPGAGAAAKGARMQADCPRGSCGDTIGGMFISGPLVRMFIDTAPTGPPAACRVGASPAGRFNRT